MKISYKIMVYNKVIYKVGYNDNTFSLLFSLYTL